MNERGWDPDVTRMFRKILRSLFFSLFWVIMVVYAGIYRELAYVHGKLTVYNIIFFVLAFITLIILVRYLVKTWK